jgi:DNA-binding PadR family transcriptional regulator
MSLRYALLGLLADEPASGYDLTGKFDRALRRYAWHAQHSQIYPELNRLAADGLIEVVEQGPRGRRTYAITGSGRSELRQWLLNPPDEFVARNELVLRLFLLSTLDPGAARPVLQSMARHSAEEVQRLRDVIDKADAGATDRTPLPFGRLAAEFGLRSFQTLHDWATWALDHLEPDPTDAA